MKRTFVTSFFFGNLKRWFLLLSLLAGYASPGLGQVHGEVRVHTRAVLHPIDPKIYGQFIEHFGRVIHQGLWAELLLNRKFYPVDPERSQVADPWRPESDLSHVSYVIDRNMSLDGVSSQRVTLFGDSRAWRGISQSGFDVLVGKEYVAYAWIKAEPADQEISFRLETIKGEVAAHAEATMLAGDWQKYEVRLKADRDLHPAVFRIAFNMPGMKWIGAASLMPADNVDGLRRDVLELLKPMAPPIMRWPGGGYSDTYDWRKAIGPRDRRPPQAILPFGQPYGFDHGIDPDDFGTDEFLRFCQLIGAEPYITANFGMGTPEMAAAWVEYCNGAADSKWGAVRAANGHPKPYGVKYWSVGNEIYGHPFESGNTNAEGYATYYIPFARAMRAVDPSLKITAIWEFANPKWGETVTKKAWDQIDFFSVHHYYPGGYWHPDLINRPLETYLAVVANPSFAEDEFRKIISLADKSTEGRKQIMVALDEWNEWDWDYPRPEASSRSWVNQVVDYLNKSALEFNHTHRDGLFGARMLHVMMRLGDRMQIGARSFTVNGLGAIRTNSTQAFVTASGKMIELYRQHSGDTLLKVETDAPAFDVPEEGWTTIPYLDAVATRSAAGRKLFLHLLNLHPTEAMEVRIHLEGGRAETRGDVWQIAPRDFLSRNDFGVTNVEIEHQVAEGLATGFVRSIPPHSATILEINLR
jgi:alpha-N-arabinofuranosidase